MPITNKSSNEQGSVPQRLNEGDDDEMALLKAIAKRSRGESEKEQEQGSNVSANNVPVPAKPTMSTIIAANEHDGIVPPRSKEIEEADDEMALLKAIAKRSRADNEIQGRNTNPIKKEEDIEAKDVAAETETEDEANLALMKVIATRSRQVEAHDEELGGGQGGGTEGANVTNHTNTANASQTPMPPMKGGVATSNNGVANVPGAYSAAPGSGARLVQRTDYEALQSGNQQSANLERNQSILMRIQEAQAAAHEERNAPMAEVSGRENVDSPTANGQEPTKEGHSIDQKKKKKHMIIAAAVGGSLLVVLAVILVVLFARGGGDGSGSQDENLQGTSPPKSMDEHLISLLPEYTLAALEESYSPQTNAFNWMKNDNFSLAGDYSDGRILQRYTLALFYYQTSKNTSSATTWLSNEHECKWSGVYCRPKDNGNVVELILENQNIHGNLPPEIGLLSNLEYLSLKGNTLEGAIPSQVGQLTKLKRMFLDDNAFTGVIPSEVGNLVNIVFFWLAMNQLSGSIPHELSQMSNTLRTLALNDNILTGKIPSFLGAFSSLTELNLENNTFTDAVPHELPPSLNVLNIARSGVRGTLPTELGLLTKLQELKTFKNDRWSGGKIAGPIPSELGLCTDMVRIESDFNMLRGTIPTQVGAMTKLHILTLNMNHNLKGPIPSEIGQCTNLEVLALDGNSLSGRLPTQLANLDSLEKLDITNNVALTGTIPSVFCDDHRKITRESFDCGLVCGCSFCPCNSEA